MRKLRIFSILLESFGCAKRAFYLANDKEVSHATLKAEYDSARARWETALTALLEDILIFDIDFYTMFLDALKPRREWFVAKTEEEGIERLLSLEENLRTFARQIAEHYRQVFLDRQSGRDV